jgi:hypothetical protein
MEEIPSLAEVGEGRNPISQTLRLLTDTTSAEHIVKVSQDESFELHAGLAGQDQTETGV